MPHEAIDLMTVACRPGALAKAVARHAADYDHLDLTGPAWGLDPLAQVAILEEMRGTLVGAAAVERAF